MRALVLVALMLAVPLGGCVGSGQGSVAAAENPDDDGGRDDPPPDEPRRRDARCRSVRVPPATVGSAFTYDAQGTPSFELTTGGAIVDWEAIGEEDQGPASNEPLRLPEGSRVRVAVGNDTRPVLDIFGNRGPAHQVTYWADHPDHSRPIAWADEWIDARSGDLVDVLSRNSKVSQGDVHYIHFYGQLNRPPVLLASLFWDEPLREGDRGEVPYPVAGEADGIFSAGEITWRTYEHEVLDVRSTDDGCMVETEVRSEDQRTVLRFTEDHPVPTAVRVYPADAGAGDPMLRMDLREASIGPGETLPVFEPDRTRRLPETTLERAPPDDGFLPGWGGLWATDFDAAVQAIRDQQDRAREWLESHPDARLVRVMHRQGHPDSAIYDEWRLTWMAPDGDRMAAGATNESTTPFRRDWTLDTFMIDDSSEYTYPQEDERRVLLSEMVSIHRAVYNGTAPEVVHCRFHMGICRVGTHRSKHWGYRCDRWCIAAENWSGGPTTGFRFDVARGFIHAEQSYHPDTAPPPAR